MRNPKADEHGFGVTESETKYVAPPPGVPLLLWESHPLFHTMRSKATNLVRTHAENIAYNKGRLAKTVRHKTGQTDWTEREARAFLRDRCHWTTPNVHLALLEAYEYGRCVPDCRFCHGATFKSLTEYGTQLRKLSLDVFNPRSALPKWGHLTGFRCHDYNRVKAGRCLDEWADYLDELDHEVKQIKEHRGLFSPADLAWKKSGAKKHPLQVDQAMF